MRKYVENVKVDKKIKDKLQHYRKEAGVYQEDVAKNLYISKRQYQILESSPTTMSYGLLNQYIDYVNDNLIKNNKEPIGFADVIYTTENNRFYGDYNLDVLDKIKTKLDELKREYDLTNMQALDMNEMKALLYILKNPYFKKYLNKLWLNIDLALKNKYKRDTAITEAQSEIDKNNENAELFLALQSGINEQYEQSKKDLEKKLYSVQSDFVKNLIKDILR